MIHDNETNHPDFTWCYTKGHTRLALTTDGRAVLTTLVATAIDGDNQPAYDFAVIDRDLGDIVAHRVVGALRSTADWNRGLGEALVAAEAELARRENETF